MNASTTTRTLEQWALLVASSVRIRERADAEKIGLMCFEAARDGRNPAVWHNSAKFYGTRCNCVPCAAA